MSENKIERCALLRCKEDVRTDALAVPIVDTSVAIYANASGDRVQACVCMTVEVEVFVVLQSRAVYKY